MRDNVIYDENGVRLEVLRLQSPTTYKEQLRIDIFIDGNPRGKIVCSVLELEKDLLRLREYGTGLLRPDIVRLRTIIDKSYREIPRISLDEIESMDDELKGIYDMFCDHIRRYKENLEVDGFIEDAYYNIPVSEFSKLLHGSKYSDCDTTVVRTRFEQLGFTKCNRGRTDRTIRMKVKAKQEAQDGTESPKYLKVISFRKSKVDERMRELPQGD